MVSLLKHSKRESTSCLRLLELAFCRSKCLTSKLIDFCSVQDNGEKVEMMFFAWASVLCKTFSCTSAQVLL